MSEESPEVRELKLTKLGSKNAEIKLTLTATSLVVEASADAPMPEWLQGEIPFEDFDVAYVDPTRDPEGDEAGEDALPPGFRVARWVEITNEETKETFPRLATMAVDREHVDLKAAEAFAATFARLAGREKPEEAPVEEPVVEEAAAEEPVEALPTGAPEPTAAREPEAGEAPAFAPPSDEAPAFAAAEPEPDASPAFAAPDEGEDDTPAFAAPDEDET